MTTSNAQATNDWFLSPVEYQGRGRAEFLDPNGSVEGATTAHFDEHGSRQITMAVDPAAIQADPPLKTGLLMELISGARIVEAGKVSVGLGGKRNPCTKLEIRTPEGVFSAIKDLHTSGYTTDFSNEGAELRFQAIESHFDATDAGPSAYWVLPLTNFLTDFTWPDPQVTDHPLRLSLTNGPVVAFEFRGKPAYIEPLLDYSDREDKLQKAQQQHLVTAVMVGAVDGSYAQFDDVATWLPFDLLPLLGVATGSEVGAPWIEFRDSQGRLVKRIHTRLGVAPFAAGPVALRENIDSGGIGAFLTEALKSPHLGQSELRVAAKYLVRGGRYNTSLEDQLAQLCRGLEGLCKHFGFAEIDLAGSLGSAEQAQVTHILQSTWQALRALAHTTGANGDLVAAQNISRIADRAKNSNQKDRPFGISVAELATQQFGLPDAAIVDAYYQTNPRPDGRKTWSDVIAYYRGTVIHESYLGYGGKPYDFDDVWTIRCHLHDLLLRIVLKMVNYSGTYQPTVIPAPARENVDWVQSHGSAQSLGYS